MNELIILQILWILKPRPGVFNYVWPILVFPQCEIDLQ